MKKILWVLLFIAIIVAVFFRHQIYTYLTTPIYWELTESEIKEIDNLRKSAYDYAVSCSGTESPAVIFEEITWILVPGTILTIQATDGTARLKGWFDTAENVIYIPFTERSTYWIMAHEAMHAIGYIGHPRDPFYTCGLMADQN